MVRQKVISLLVSVVSLGVFALLMVKGIAAFERRSFEANRTLLTAGAQHVESQLAEAGDDLPGLAARVASDAELVQSARMLTATLELLETTTAPKPVERLKANATAFTKKINDRLTTLRTEMLADGIDAMTLVGDDGLVLVSDSSTYQAGNRLPVPPPPEETASGDGASPALAGARPAAGAADLPLEGLVAPAPTAAPSPDAAGTAAKPAQAGALAGAAPAGAAPGAVAGTQPPPAPPGTELVIGALRSNQTHGAFAKAGSIVHVGAAQLLLKGRQVGAVLLERRLRTLPQPSGVDALLVVGNAVVLGKEPAGFSPPSSAPKTPFLLVPRTPYALVPSIGEVPFAPLFVTADSTGIWAQRFKVPGVPQASGFVLADVTPLMSELGGFQALTIAVALAVFLVHAFIILLAGRRIMGGIETMADVLSHYQQGLSDTLKINERQLPAGLHRLARLVNKMLERAPAVATTAPAAARGPTLDEVMEAQVAPEPSNEMIDLEFEGITNAGSIDLSTPDPISKPAFSAAAAPPPPPVADEDGYESLSELGDTALAAAAAMEETPRAATLPEIPDALEAMEHLTDDQQWFSESSPPPPPAEGDDGGSDQLLSSADFGAGTADLMSAFEDAAPEPPAMQPPEPEQPAMSLASDDDLEQSFVFGDDLEPEPEPAPDEDPKLAHYREVFAQFVQTREQCGESTADLVFDKFTIKLDQSRDAVVAKHACNDVLFSVYVKNGKAALKATPAK